MYIFYIGNTTFEKVEYTIFQYKISIFISLCDLLRTLLTFLNTYNKVTLKTKFQTSQLLFWW